MKSEVTLEMNQFEGDTRSEQGVNTSTLTFPRRQRWSRWRKEVWDIDKEM